MTSATPVPRTRRVSGFGIASLILCAVAVLPVVAIILIGLLPDMMAIYWLLIVVLPFAVFAGGVAVLLGVVGIILAARARASLVLPIVGVVIGFIVVILPTGVLSGWFV